MAKEKAKTEGKVKRWWRKHKGTVKVIVGGTVIAGAAVALTKYVRGHYALTSEDDEDGTTVRHNFRPIPTKMLLDSDAPLAKFGVEDYDLYDGAIEFMQDEYGPLKISDIGDLGQAVKETCPDVSDDSTVWCLLNIARDIDNHGYTDLAEKED